MQLVDMSIQEGDETDKTFIYLLGNMPVRCNGNRKKNPASS
jgi:hypothetical protein